MISTTPTLRSFSLTDRLDINCPEILISGSQSIVRIMMLQREWDRRHGLNTAGYVSGYRGSPLGGIDMTLWKAEKQLKNSDITFQPGVNEDLAATSVWGTQQLKIFGKAKVDGVFGLWYGKGPGVDRSGDVIKHANYAGVHPNGGVLAVFGDDHPGKSSTIAHHSEQAMASNGLPVLYPSNVQDVLRFGMLGYAMSRYSGAWVSVKLVNETAEQTAVASFDLSQFSPVTPDAQDLLPPEGVHFRGVYGPLRDETILLNHRLPLVARFARANSIDQVSVGEQGKLGIVTAGKAYQDVRQALSYLGIDDARARQIGVAVYKVGMIWPLEEVGLRDFAIGRQELLVVEEKAAFIEPQIAAILYNDTARPRVVGKKSPDGSALVPAEALLEPMVLARVIASRMQLLGLWDENLDKRLKGLQSYRSALLAIVPSESRTPYFCSGCPHNTSTKLPDGSIAVAGIGCHGMAMWAKPNTLISTHMGGEGLNWVGLSRYTEVPHIFQNMGDGTYFHSGLMAIRASIAAGANITYKILFNDAVAMTGGQPVDGQISVSQIVTQVISEGARRVVVVSEDPGHYSGENSLPPEVPVFHRDELDRVQREIREILGCTVIVYEQTCAAEKRRRRKKSEFPDPPQRMFINAAVCEGCGDCSVQSGCVSLEPLETSLGRKRFVNQGSCNKDFSCVKGFCPSFVTVRGGKIRRPALAQVPDELLKNLPEPSCAEIGEFSYAIMVAGIGGTGVVTITAVLAVAAHLEHKYPSTYDMTGLSQKNGAVYSHLRIARRPERITSQRVGAGEANLVLAFDMVAALGDESYQSFSPKRTRLVGNDRVAPTAAIITDPQAQVNVSGLQNKVTQRIGTDAATFVDASGLAKALLGDEVGANMFLLGVAFQCGCLPIGFAAIERAIELNGAQVDMNKRAFKLGRLWVVDPQSLHTANNGRLATHQESVITSLEQVISERSTLLTNYQDAKYAQRYLALIERVKQAEGDVRSDVNSLTRSVAENFAKLMAYKDEYEVARLYTDPAFMQSLRQEFDGDIKLSFNLAPPMLSRRDPQTGLPKKREFRSWILPAMSVLSRLRFLRGTPLDVFGYTIERRTERALVDEYEALILGALPKLNRENIDLVTQLAALPHSIRGYGHVKDSAIEKAKVRQVELLAELNRAAFPG